MTTIEFEVFTEDAAAISVDAVDVVHLVRLPNDETRYAGKVRRDFLSDAEYQQILNILNGVLNGLNLNSTRAATLAARGDFL